MALFNPDNQEDIGRLKQALVTSKEELRPLLSQRKECLTAYQGHRFSSESMPKSADPRMSIPLMEIAVDLHEQLLAGESVRAVVAPRRSDLAPLGELVKDTLDLLMDAIEIGQTFQDWVKETLWGCGVAKVGLSFERGRIRGRGGGFTRRINIPFVDIIDFDDLLIDTSASRWNRKKFIGNRYFVPLDWAKATPGFKADARKELQAIDPELNRPIGSSSPIPRRFDSNALFPMTELNDVYLPLDQMILTISPNGPKDVLRKERWKGPSTGPYHLLGYEFVPNTVIPKPMAWAWIDAHTSVNVMYNMAVRQALRSKRNPLVPVGAEKDAERLKDARDGDWVPVTKPELIQTFVVPGADPSLLNLVGQLINVFSFMAGNVNLLAGLSAQSPTLGQDKILQGGGSRRMAELQRRSKRAFAGVMSALAWYLFRERDLRVRMERKVGDISIPVRLRHEDLKGRFLEFNFDIEPIRHKSPDERLGLLLNWIREVVLPLQGQMGQAGFGLDIQELHRIGRDYGDIPELDRIIRNLGRNLSPQETAALTGGGGRGSAGGGAQGQGGAANIGGNGTGFGFSPSPAPAVAGQGGFV
jgi:hypothetical protein